MAEAPNIFDVRSELYRLGALDVVIVALTRYRHRAQSSMNERFAQKAHQLVQAGSVTASLDHLRRFLDQRRSGPLWDPSGSLSLAGLIKTPMAEDVHSAIPPADGLQSVR